MPPSLQHTAGNKPLTRWQRTAWSRQLRMIRIGDWTSAGSLLALFGGPWRLSKTLA
jgi:hypothetical protein